MTITTAQIRGARGILNWSQAELAERTGISATSIGSIENGVSSPRANTLATIQRAFEEAGIEFLPASGVRLRDELILVKEGPDALDNLLDDIYKSLLDKGGEVMIFGLEEKVDPHADEYQKIHKHLDRILDSGITERIILREGDTNFAAPEDFYRWIEPEYFSPYPFILYGNKLAMINWGPPCKVLIIDSSIYSQTFKKIFDIIWKNATKPTGKKTALREGTR
jgi:transcriptional regulator with XRE-family HTH domain